jgi:hypothetical protein
MYMYLCIHLFTHINLRNHLSCIYLFICVRYIYLRIRVLCSDDSFIYLLFIYLSCLFIYVCVTYNNVRFIYVFIYNARFIYLSTYMWFITQFYQCYLLTYVYVIYVTMTVSYIYLLFIYNARLIYLFTYAWFINNNASFVCLYRKGLFIL